MRCELIKQENIYIKKKKKYFLILHTQNTAETMFVVVSKMQMQPTIAKLILKKILQ